MTSTAYDFVIVGGGSAACALAMTTWGQEVSIGVAEGCLQLVV